MSIKDFWLKIKRKLLLVLICTLTVSLLVGIALLASQKLAKKPLKISNPAGYVPASVFTAAMNAKLGEGGDVPVESGPVRASSRGKVYYYPWCSGYEKLKVSNQITFASKEAAEVAGYRKAASCGRPGSSQE